MGPLSLAPYGDQGAGKLGDDEGRNVQRADAGEGIGQGARDRHRRVGEARRGREPVGGGDVEADAPRHGGGAEADTDFQPVVARRLDEMNLRVASPDRLEEERETRAQLGMIEAGHLTRLRQQLRNLNGCEDDNELPF